MTRYIFVTGGVVSSLGKGLTSAALGALLQARGFKVRLRKLDPYLNVDPGTMSPYQHGEVYVTGRRLRDRPRPRPLRAVHRTVSSLTRDSNVHDRPDLFQGAVIDKERRGEYPRGKTVQVIPARHRTRSRPASPSSPKPRTPTSPPDVVITEIGGTVGDIESQPFSRRSASTRQRNGRERSACSCTCTLVPYIAAAGELKTKPTQHSVKELQSARSASSRTSWSAVAEHGPSAGKKSEQDRAVLQRAGPRR